MSLLNSNYSCNSSSFSKDTRILLSYTTRSSYLLVTRLLCILARYQGTARLMFNSFSSSLWMLPFSKHCRADSIYSKHFSGCVRKNHHIYQCDEEEFRSNYSGWPTNLVNIEIPLVRGMISYVCFLGMMLQLCSYFIHVLF